MVASIHHTALQRCCIAFAPRINHIVNTIMTHFCSQIEAIVKSYTDGQILLGTLLRASWQPLEKCQTDSNRMSILYEKHSCSIPVGITLPQHLCIPDQLMISRLDKFYLIIGI